MTDHQLQVRLLRLALGTSLVVIGLLVGLVIRQEFLDARQIKEPASAATVRPANARPAVLDEIGRAHV